MPSPPGCLSARSLMRGWMDRSCLNLKEAAERIGVSNSLLSHYLGGDRIPSLENAVRIWRVTGVSMEAWVAHLGAELGKRPRRKAPKSFVDKESSGSRRS